MKAGTVIDLFQSKDIRFSLGRRKKITEEWSPSKFSLKEKQTFLGVYHKRNFYILSNQKQVYHQSGPTTSLCNNYRPKWPGDSGIKKYKLLNWRTDFVSLEWRKQIKTKLPKTEIHLREYCQNPWIIKLFNSETGVIKAHSHPSYV